MRKLLKSLLPAALCFILASCGAKTPERKEYTGYLFAHMTASNYGHLYYSLSRDGKSWETLNAGEVVLDDYLGHPNIVRGAACGPTDDFSKGECFYMIGVSTSGDLRFPILWYSRDLLTWQHKDLTRELFDVSAFGYENEDVYMGAPKIFYDEDSSRYMVTWHAFGADTVGNNPHWESMRTYYIITSDWEHFTAPQRLFDFDGDDASMATIDVILYKDQGKYFAVIKDERWPETAPTGKTIRVASSDILTGPYCNPGPSITGVWEEAPVAVRKVDGSGWYLFTERYTEHKYLGYETDTFNATQWNPVEIASPEKGRHGCVIPVTEEEFQALSALK